MFGVLALGLVLSGPAIVGVAVALWVDTPAGGYVASGVAAALSFVALATNLDPYDTPRIAIYEGAAALAVVSFMLAVAAVLAVRALRSDEEYV